MDSTSVDWPHRYHAELIITVRIRTRDVPGTLGRVLTTVGRFDTSIGDVRLVELGSRFKTREVQMFFRDQAHMDATLGALAQVPDVELVAVVDEVLEVHRGGTIRTAAIRRLATTMDLRTLHWPGASNVCEAIHERPGEVWTYSRLPRRVALVTDGSAVPGVGAVRARAALPAIEAKAALLAQLAGLDGQPVLLDTSDLDAAAEALLRTAAGYGAIQLEHMRPEIARGLAARLGPKLLALPPADRVPLLDDRGHGAAAVALAAGLSALRLARRPVAEASVAVLGTDPVAVGLVEACLELGVRSLVLCDAAGPLHAGRADLEPALAALAARLPTPESEVLPDVLADRALVVVTTEAAERLDGATLARLAPWAAVLSVGEPDVGPSSGGLLRAGVAVAIDPRELVDPLADPGLLRGTLDARAHRVTPAMVAAAATALADAAAAESDDDPLLPDILRPGLHDAVADAVRHAAG